MAASPRLKSSFVLILSNFMLLASSKSIPFSSSSIASGQYEFWSANVLSNMPNAILSQLSPLSLHDSQYITSLASKSPFVFDAKFCALANLACAANLLTIQVCQKAYLAFVQPRILHDKSLQAATRSHVDPFSYFRLSVLKQGERVHLPDLKSPLPSRAFLPSQIATKISLNSDELKRVFPQSFVPPLTSLSIEIMALFCQAPPLKGEIKNCTKSLEDMIEFSQNAVGQKHLLALTSKSSRGSGRELIIGNIEEYHDAEKIVSCHEVFFPFATYFCHLVSSTRFYAVDLLEPDKRVQVNRVLAVCHMDTSEWQHDHAAFKVLNISPGEGEACHWFSEGDLAFIGA